MRDSWTDERLDDLNEKVDKGFADVGERFKEVDKRFDKLEDRFEGLQKDMNHRFETVHKLIFQGLLGIVGAMITGFFGLAGLIISQM
jgi:hypothetical protein